MFRVEELPFATAGLAGCGGRLRAQPEDFVVTELPLYEPSGAGEHLYVEVEKTGLSTPQVIAHFCGALGLPGSAVGHAGLKDAQAVARQWFSLHVAHDPPAAALERPGLRVLRSARHGNKLRRGHLRGNRFAIRIRGAQAPAQWPQAVEHLRAQGFPNFFGPQRLGVDGENAARGKALLLRPPGRTPHGRSRMQPERLRFLLNAYQSALFNALVAERLNSQGGLHTVLPGDLAVLHRNGASFPVQGEDLPAAQRRADAHELSPSAPLFGWQVPLAEGAPGECERELLAREQLTLDTFRLASKRDSPRGERRPVRAFAEELTWRVEAGASGPGQDLLLEFILPAGTYATALLRELMKPQDTQDRIAPPAEVGAFSAVGDAP